MNSLRARQFSVLLVVFMAALAVYAAFARVNLTPQIVSQESFQVVGISASTNNAKEAGPDAIIGTLWQQFLSQGLLNKIPDRVDQSITAVYTDYVSDANGQYTFVLGARIRPIPDPVLPEGMVIKTVPAGRYAVFTSERGPVAKVVVETWKQIWAYFQNPANGQRAYRADFEVYDQRSADPNNTQVDIYVGVR
jgi:predicted transcriptional regulator YdeE